MSVLGEERRSPGFDALLFGILSTFFLSGSVIMVEGVGWLQYPLLTIGGAGALLLLLDAGCLNRERPWSLVPLSVFLFAGLLAALVNESGMLLVLVLGVLVVWVLLARALPSVAEERRLLKLIVASALVTHLPLLMLPFVRGFQLPLRGIFYNPNSYGTVAATLYAVVLPIFLVRMGEKRRSWPRVVCLAGLAIGLFLAATASASRTSFLAVTGLTLAALFLLASDIIEGVRIKSSAVRLLAVACSGLVVASIIAYLWLPAEELINAFILGKFEVKAGNVTAGRMDVWMMTIEEARLFGRGRSYFLQTTELGAHNTFVSILGQYGWIAVVSYVALWVGILRHSLGYARRTDEYDLYRWVPVSVTLCFLALSMGEGMNGKLSMLIAFACVGATTSIRSAAGGRDRYRAAGEGLA